MLEKMDDFFTARVNGYDEHMKNNIEGADSFYQRGKSTAIYKA